jgi:hypothetical protein
MFFPEISQLFRPEIGQHFAIDLNHRRQFLSGQPDHFVKGLYASDDIHGFVFNPMGIHSIHRLVAPRAIGFDEKAGVHPPIWLMY